MAVRFAVIGAGRIGKVHAKAIRSVDGAELVCIVEPMETLAKQVSEEFDCELRSQEAAIAATDVDAIVICTPTDTHADLIEAGAKAGKAVFCEKPIDLSLKRVQECLKVVEDTNATLMVAFQRRYDPDFNALKSAIDDGKIGQVEMITLTSRDPGPPPYEYIERSGGIFRDMSIHDLDVARWLLAEEVETVQASGSCLVDPEIGKRGDFDSVNLILRTASGKQCTINNSRRAVYGYDQRIEVLGSEGVISAENHTETRVTIGGENGFTTSPAENFFMSRYEAAYAAEIQHFVECVQTGNKPRTTGQDGLMALALAEAAVLSVAEQRVVRVEEILA